MTSLKQQPPHLLRGIPLAVQNLKKAFGPREVLKDIDLHIPAGQFVAIGSAVAAAVKAPCCACLPVSTNQPRASCSQALRRWTMPAKTRA